MVFPHGQTLFHSFVTLIVFFFGEVLFVQPTDECHQVGSLVTFGCHVAMRGVVSLRNRQQIVVMFLHEVMVVFVRQSFGDERGD